MQPALLVLNRQLVVTAVLQCIKKPVALQDIKTATELVFHLLNVAAVAQAVINAIMEAAFLHVTLSQVKPDVLMAHILVPMVAVVTDLVVAVLL